MSTDRCSSPRPDTLKASVDSVSSTRRDTSVFRLPNQPIPDVAAGYKLALQTRQRGVIDHEMHGDGGLTDLLEGDGGYLIGRAQCIPDMNVSNA